MSSKRVAIVTGSSRGIGRAIAIQLAKDGLNVVINYQSNSAKAQEAVEEINALIIGKDTTVQPGAAIAVQGDVSDMAVGQRLIDETIKAFGRIDVVVINAAWVVFKRIHDVTPYEYEMAFKTNVQGPMFFTQQLLPYLQQQTNARVIFISSSLTADTQVAPPHLLLCSTKGALEQMTRVLAKDLGSLGKGITVNCVSPGATDTDALRESNSEEILEHICRGSPLKRLGQPEEMTGLVSFLAGDKSGWVLGQVIGCNGGAVL
ncbi:hypothetical protein EDD11_009616 [Mortierella claussenii]|nr:hypothetical protein EDD11_009616 [Mortierella claussenii]